MSPKKFFIISLISFSIGVIAMISGVVTMALYYRTNSDISTAGLVVLIIGLLLYFSGFSGIMTYFEK